ncbi:Protein CBG00494 [Caenorhabditis briggsae]|uniref:Protein CBG00494 n=1 Tax=Caenorhabditis briggsae TaxID=6238 RepID=A8WMS9_CAEBR|nr:Protein CBG00494 [Caenorhabditis briggsae]CAP21784.1 Protein CBG00494 [Caenorhabditis briggsae]
MPSLEHCISINPTTFCRSFDFFKCFLMDYLLILFLNIYSLYSQKNLKLKKNRRDAEKREYLAVCTLPSLGPGEIFLDFFPKKSEILKFQPKKINLSEIFQANCCIWFSLLSKRLHSIHPSFCVIFLVLLVLKAVQFLILAFESTVDAGVIAELILLMAETALLSKSTKRLGENEEKSKLTPEEKSSFVSRIFFWWLNPLIKSGAKNPLTNENLHNLNQNATSEWLYTRWRDEFRKEKESRSKRGGAWVFLVENKIFKLSRLRGNFENSPSYEQN